MRAFIIGNGPSRKDFDLKQLAGGHVYGCNALYRDFWPDYLVAIDPKIISEIKGSEFPSDRFIIPPEEEQWEPQDYRPGYRTRSNAGMNACLEAIKQGADELFLLGFDFVIADKDVALGNLYDGTNGYEMETRTTFSDTIARVKYFQWFADKFPETTFYVVLPEETDVHPLYVNNVRGMYYKELKELCSNSKITKTKM